MSGTESSSVTSPHLAACLGCRMNICWLNEQMKKWMKLLLCFSCFIFFSLFLNGSEKQQSCLCHKAFRIKGSSEAWALRWLVRTALITWLVIRTQRKESRFLRALSWSARSQRLLISLDNRVPPALIAFCFMTSCPGWCDNIWDSCFEMTAFPMKINVLPDGACRWLYCRCENQILLLQ